MKTKLKYIIISLLFVINTVDLFATDPKLILFFNIENMRPDYLSRYSYNFQNNGFKMLLNKGAICKNARMHLSHQDKAAATATIFTGTYPNKHGISNSSWYNHVKRSNVEAVSDKAYQTVGSDSEEGRCSAKNLMAPTIGDELKLLSNGKSKVYSVSANANTAILSAGHSSDGAFWIDNKTGNMISSSYFISNFPSWAFSFNNGKHVGKILDKNWELLYLGENNYPASDVDNGRFEKGFYGEKNTFPHNMNRLYNQTKNYSFIKETPFGNDIIADFAETIIKRLDLGDDNHTDMLTVNFTSLADGFGPQSIEMEDFYVRLDINIASILNIVDKKIGLDNVLVVLSSICADSYSTEYLESLRYPTGNVKPENIVALLTSFLNVTYGAENWIKASIDQEIYFDKELIKKKGVDWDDMLNKSVEFINQFEGVDIAISANTLLKGNFSSGQLYSLNNSFNAQRSGDILFSINSSWQTVCKYPTKKYTNDNRIALIMMSPKVKSGTFYNSVNAIDIAPTVFLLSGYNQSSSCSGQIINSIIKQ